MRRVPPQKPVEGAEEVPEWPERLGPESVGRRERMRQERLAVGP